MFLPHRILEEKLLKILSEDTGQGDTTTALIVPKETVAEAKIIAKDSGIIAGIEETKVLLGSLGLNVEALVEDGEKIKPKQILAKVSGDAQTILAAERTVLNILSRMSGIATTTRKLTEKLQKAGVKAKVASTRKTAPGLLFFDKKSVLVGGGDTHRLHLDDMILIKDNHIVIAGSVEKAVKRARERASFSKKIEVEVTRIEDIVTSTKAGADIIMLDNFTPEKVREACTTLKKAKTGRKVLFEASGGINAENILDYALTGVDIVSLGEITDSVKALDMSLEVTKVVKKQLDS